MKRFKMIFTIILIISQMLGMIHVLAFEDSTSPVLGFSVEPYLSGDQIYAEFEADEICMLYFTIGSQGETKTLADLKYYGWINEDLGMYFQSMPYFFLNSNDNYSLYYGAVDIYGNSTEVYEHPFTYSERTALGSIVETTNLNENTYGIIFSANIDIYYILDEPGKTYSKEEIIDGGKERYLVANQDWLPLPDLIDGADYTLYYVDDRLGYSEVKTYSFTFDGAAEIRVISKSLDDVTPPTFQVTNLTMDETGIVNGTVAANEMGRFYMKLDKPDIAISPYVLSNYMDIDETLENDFVVFSSGDHYSNQEHRFYAFMYDEANNVSAIEEYLVRVPEFNSDIDILSTETNNANVNVYFDGDGYICYFVGEQGLNLSPRDIIEIGTQSFVSSGSPLMLTQLNEGNFTLYYVEKGVVYSGTKTYDFNVDFTSVWAEATSSETGVNITFTTSSFGQVQYYISHIQLDNETLEAKFLGFPFPGVESDAAEMIMTDFITNTATISVDGLNESTTYYLYYKNFMGLDGIHETTVTTLGTVIDEPEADVEEELDTVVPTISLSDLEILGSTLTATMTGSEAGTAKVLIYGQNQEVRYEDLGESYELGDVLVYSYEKANLTTGAALSIYYAMEDGAGNKSQIGEEKFTVPYTSALTGTITDGTTGLAEVTVKVVKGGTSGSVYGQTTTDENGFFTFSALPYGTYSLVGTKGDGIVTQAIIVQNPTTTQNLIMPSGKQKTLVVVGVDTPSVAVSNLEDMFSIDDRTIIEDGGEVIITLKVEQKNEASVSEDSALMVTELQRGKHVGAYFDISLLKTIIGAADNDLENVLIQPPTGGKVQIVLDLPEALQDKAPYQIMRVHDGNVSLLEVTYDPDLQTLTFDTDAFSTYSIVYTLAPDTVDSDAPGSSKKSKINTTVDQEETENEPLVSNTGMVAQKIPLPVGMAYDEITTAVFYDRQGKRHHVPTRITMENGEYYIIVNSFYPDMETELIYNVKSFDDIQSHWAKDDVEDLASRLIVNGVDSLNFMPDRSITRAEFAALVIRALGINDNGSVNPFDDVEGDAWYVGAVNSAAEYGLINGYGDGTFRPENLIDREQAMSIVARAQLLIEQDGTLEGLDLGTILEKQTDYSDISDWVRNQHASKETITRAEAVVMSKRLLKNLNLIN